MARGTRGNSAPAWALPAAIVALVLIVGFFAWRNLGPQINPNGAPMEVHPGQFSIEKEAAAGRLGNGLKGGALTGHTNVQTSPQ